MWLSKFFIFLAFCCFTLRAEKARFDNYRVYTINVDTAKQLEILRELEYRQDGISFFEPPTTSHSTAELIVPPHKLADITELFDKYKISAALKIPNLQKLIDEEQPTFSPRANFGWNQYYDLSQIYKWIDQLFIEYPDILTNYNYGKSYENRTIRAVKISHKPGNPTIFIESTIHAREWVTVATATYLMNELITSTDPEVRQLADSFDFVFVPVVNVDGYAYTHSHNRMWRKTRQPHPILKTCIGADPNRNFDFHHSESGASEFPCAETYAGPKPFSEPEILSLSEFIKTFDNIKLYISFHSYGQLLLFPYGYSKQHTPNHKDLNQIGLKTKGAIQTRFGTEYKVGNIADAIYLASGSSIDWVYAKCNVSLTYTFEFRDKRYGNHGFILPPDQIIPNSLEVLDGLKAMIQEAKSLHYL